MHSCVYVIIGKTGDIETLVATAMQPFNEDLAVDRYKLHLSASTVVAMARHYNLRETDRKSLAKKIRDWVGCPGGEDELGLFALCSHNPDGKFDWYEIGGRFNGCVLGKHRPRPFATSPSLDANLIAVSDLLRMRDFNKRLPVAVVTPHGEWIERSKFVENTTGWFLREQPLRDWQRIVRRVLRTFVDHRVVCVDSHC